MLFVDVKGSRSFSADSLGGSSRCRCISTIRRGDHLSYSPHCFLQAVRCLPAFGGAVSRWADATNQDHFEHNTGYMNHRTPCSHPAVDAAWKRHAVSNRRAFAKKFLSDIRPQGVQNQTPPPRVPVGEVGHVQNRLIDQYPDLAAKNLAWRGRCRSRAGKCCCFSDHEEQPESPPSANCAVGTTPGDSRVPKQIPNREVDSVLDYACKKDH